MSAADPVTVGIIGAGQGVRTHAAVLSQLPGVRLVGLTGLTVDFAQAALRSRDLDPDLACPLDVLLDRKPDLVCLATPPTVRADFVTALARTQSALLIEKPLEASLVRARQVYAPLADHPQPVFLNVQLRGLPAFQQLRQSIVDGQLGQVHTLTVRERTGWRRSYAADWQLSRAAGGGQRLDMGPHLLDLAVFLLGGSYRELRADLRLSASRLSSPTGSAVEDDVAEDVFQTAFRYRDCWVVLYTTSTATGPDMLEFDLDGTAGRASFTFASPGSASPGGSLSVYLESVNRTHRLADDGTWVPGPTPAPASLFKLAYRYYIERVLAAVRGAAPDGLVSLEDGLANQAVLDDLGAPS